MIGVVETPIALMTAPFLTALYIQPTSLRNMKTASSGGDIMCMYL